MRHTKTREIGIHDCINGGQQFSPPAVVRTKHGFEVGPVFPMPCNGKYKP